jgi:hypothetical protein
LPHRGQTSRGSLLDRYRLHQQARNPPPKMRAIKPTTYATKAEMTTESSRMKTAVTAAQVLVTRKNPQMKKVYTTFRDHAKRTAAAPRN